MDRSDAQLLAAATAGDAGAFEALYDRHSRAVFSTAVAVLGSREEAEDVAQEVFLRLWRRAAGVDEARGTLAAYLTTIARNLAIDRLRRLTTAERSRRALAALESVRQEQEVPDLVAGRDEAERLHRALAEIPAAQAHVVRLSHLDGRSHSEIAAATGLPVGTVKSRSRLGVRNLRDRLAPAA